MENEDKRSDLPSRRRKQVATAPPGVRHHVSGIRNPRHPDDEMDLVIIVDPKGQYDDSSGT